MSELPLRVETLPKVQAFATAECGMCKCDVTSSYGCHFGPTGRRAETADLTEAHTDTRAAVFGTHLQAEPPGSPTSLFVTETQKFSSFLSLQEAAFLPNGCSFVRYLGSGLPGTCSCTAGLGSR